MARKLLRGVEGGTRGRAWPWRRGPGARRGGRARRGGGPTGGRGAPPGGRGGSGGGPGGRGGAGGGWRRSRSGRRARSSARSRPGRPSGKVRLLPSGPTEAREMPGRGPVRGGGCCGGRPPPRWRGLSPGALAASPPSAPPTSPPARALLVPRPRAPFHCLAGAGVNACTPPCSHSLTAGSPSTSPPWNT